MNLKILYEDNSLIIVDKPAGITVNRSDTTKDEETVQDWLENRLGLQNDLDDSASDFLKRGGIVHRLDKETSGILITAKDEITFTELQRQFKERTVEKTYVALVHGKVAGESGEISVPVGRLPWNRKRFGVLAGGREATTFYKVLERFNKEGGLTLLELKPKTGRTHQIRVHLKYFNHPVYSDFLYAGRKTARGDRKKLERVFLHAAKITFRHPKTGEKVYFESDLPEELYSFLETIRA
jgi:23S rRNA pseudouridine1911/1915/1917 synthase